MEEQAVVNNQIQQPPVNPASPKPGAEWYLAKSNYCIIGGIILILLLIFATIYVRTLPLRKPISPPPKPLASPPPISPNPTPIIIPTTDPLITANWKTYTNKKYGYSMQYPSSWNVKEIDHIFKSKLIDGHMVSMTNISGKEGSVKIFFEGEFDHGLELITLEKEETISVGGKSAKKETYKFQNNINKWIIISIDNFHHFRIEMQGHPSLLPTFDQILSTFKFTPASPTGGDQKDQVVCTQDVKECPDGSYVSRQPPTCEFAPCP